MLTITDWADMPEEWWRDHNTYLTVYAGALDGEKIVWEGWAVGWIETGTGSLSVRRTFMVTVEPTDGHQGEIVQVITEAVLIKTWSKAVSKGVAYDPETLAAQQRANREAQEAAAEAQAAANLERAGVAMPGQMVTMPNRQQRRHPGR